MLNLFMIAGCATAFLFFVIIIFYIIEWWIDNHE